MKPEDYVGKTIEKIETWKTGVEITFTDGSKIEFFARGSEEQWLEVSCE